MPLSTHLFAGIRSMLTLPSRSPSSSSSKVSGVGRLMGTIDSGSLGRGSRTGGSSTFGDEDVKQYAQIEHEGRG